MKYLATIALLFPCLLINAAASKNEQQPAPDSLSKQVSFLALGDSYTIGESVGNLDRFPDQVANILRSKNIPVSSPRYIARTGWTTADLQNAISESHLQPPFGLVTLLIGVNDQFQGLDTAGYRSRFNSLLQKAIELAGNQIAHVFVLSIPDYGVTPFGRGSTKISREINDFNAINKAVTIAYKVTYIDITPLSRLAGTDQSLTAGDGLHPSAKQYQQWAMKLAEAMLSVFSP
jgi:lysophospholipase L1-like esterase